MGNAYLLGANVVLGWFITELDKRFHFEENDDMADYVRRNESINDRIARGDITGLARPKS